MSAGTESSRPECCRRVPIEGRAPGLGRYDPADQHRDPSPPECGCRPRGAGGPPCDSLEAPGLL